MTLCIKGYRVKGGALVTVIRGDRRRRYRVSLLRFARLRFLFAVWNGSSGHDFHGSLEMRLREPKGYFDAVHACQRYGGAKGRALFPRALQAGGRV